MALNDTRIRNAKPKDRPYRLADGRGLSLEIRPNGAKLWRYRYRIGGKENVYAIGCYSNGDDTRVEVSLADARDELDRARKLVKAGTHPAHHRKANTLRKTHENANTFEAVAREWLKSNQAHWTPRTHRQRERLLEEDVFPAIGGLPIRQVTSAHAHAILKTIEQRAPQMAVIARQAFSAISHLAIATLRADVDISYPLRKAIRTKPTQHKQVLRVNEIPAFFKALDRYPGYFPTTAAIRLLWWTLARPTEVVGAKWSEFDLENAIWTIPASRMKQRQPHAVPLPKQAVELLGLLKGVTRASDYLVPNRHHPKKGASPTILVKAFVSMGYDGKFTPHGVRATGRTILGEQGHPRDVLERQIAHRDKKEVRAYDQGDRLEARRVVMQGWANYLDSICAGGNVVNIKASA